MQRRIGWVPVLLVTAMVHTSCSSPVGTDVGSRAHISALALLEDGGLVVRYDLAADIADARLAITPLEAPDEDVIAIDRPEVGRDRRSVFGAEQLGRWAHHRLNLRAVLRDGRGRELATCRAR